jgi:Uma2 family endonuclease
MTIDEYLYDTDETNRIHELAMGRLREPPAPFFSHQSLVLKVATTWSQHVESGQLGRVAIAPVDVVLDKERSLILQPDVLFISTPRLSIIRDQIWGPPDLIAEVLSVGTAKHDRGDKLGWYFQYGVRECWLVDPFTQSVAVFDFAGPSPAAHTAIGADAIRSGVLPELKMTARDLFA